MRLVPIQPPDVEPLTVEELRARLNIVDDGIADEVLSAFITSARQGIDGVDGWIGRALITQTWQLLLPGFPSCDGGRINIPLPPLQDVTAISYVDGDGATATLVSSDFDIRQGPRPFIEPAYGKSWPSARYGSDAVTIEFIAGYGDEGENVPEPIRSAIALQVSNIRSLTARNLFVSSTTTEGVGSTSYVVGSGAGQAIDAAVLALLGPFRVIA